MNRIAVFALAMIFVVAGCETPGDYKEADVKCAKTWIEYKDAAVAFNLCVKSDHCSLTPQDIVAMNNLERKVVMACPFDAKPPDTVVPLSDE